MKLEDLKVAIGTFLLQIVFLIFISDVVGCRVLARIGASAWLAREPDLKITNESRLTFIVELHFLTKAYMAGIGMGCT